MTTLAVALAEIAALKARVDALESGKGTASSSSGAPSGDELPPALPDSMLENDWAQGRLISKDPKQWKGKSQIGRTYAKAPVEWLEMMAKNMAFKAKCGREENPVRMNNKGKPWHESDLFEAKLLLAWANRNRNKPPPAPKAPAPSSVADDDFDGFATPSGDPMADIPFIHQARGWSRP